MASPILVAHPVPFRYRPPRSRAERLGHAAGATSVEIREFEEAPTEITREGGVPVVAADGRAWMRFAHLSPGSLRAVLEGEGDSPARPSRDGVLDSYLKRSPLCWLNDGTAGRGGDVEPALGAAAEGDAARASGAVRRFVDDRIRVGGGEVFLRYEGIMLAKRLGDAFLIRFPDFPRQANGVATEVTWRCPGLSAVSRGDEFGTLRDTDIAHKRHRVIPEDLLGEDDAVWFANVLPARALVQLRKRRLAEDLDEEGRAELRELVGVFGPLADLGMTLSHDGDALRPALLSVLDAVERLSALYARAAHGDRIHANRDGAATFGHAARTIRSFAIPRLGARHAAPSDDVESLAQLSF